MIKLFHYDIYEYELLQKELNKLASKGYTTSKISYITFFKKTDNPSYFLVDIFTPNEKSLTKKREEKSRYIDYYLERDYEQISNFKNILVFKGNTKIKTRPIQRNLSKAQKSKRILQFFLSLLLLFFVVTVFIMPLKPYHLLTNGKILLYVSITFFSIYLCYRSFLRWNGIYQLSQSISKKEKYNFKNIKIHYRLSSIIPIITIMMLLVSMIFDSLDTQNLSTIPSNIPTLKNNFNISEKTEYSLLKRTSWIVPESYEYVEYTNHQEKALYVQVYQLRNQESIQDMLQYFLDNPKLLYVKSIKKLDDQNYLGYDEHNKSYIKIKIQDHTITLINTNFEIK